MQRKESNLWKEIHEQDKCISKCIQINEPKVAKIVEEFKKRNLRNIIFVGRGSSEHAAILGKYLIEVNSRYQCNVMSPSVVSCYDSNMSLKDSMVIGISQSGVAQDCYLVMKKCENDGGLCVSVTNEEDTIMNMVGEYHLNNECGVEKSVTAAKSYITQAVVVSLFAAYLANNSELLKSIYNLPEDVKNAYDFEEDVGKIVPYYRNIDRILLFARGLMFAVTQEAELKIQETCYLEARNYASSDYQHGPIATTQKFVPTIFLIADSKTNQSTFDLHNRLKEEYDIHSLIITNNEKYTKSSDLNIILDDRINELSAVFTSIVIFQMFACLLSIERGFNPDSPVGVSKHTVTI